MTKGASFTQPDVLCSITRATGAEGGYLTRMAALYLASTSCNGAVCAMRALSEASGFLVGLHIAFAGFPFPVGACFVLGKQRHDFPDAARGRVGAFDAWL